jgi:hypothetical protein
MWTGMRKAVGLAIVLGLTALASAGCGSSGDETTTPPRPPLSAATADHLAKLSNRIADDLDAGDTCSAAYVADDLKSAVEDADLSASLRPGVEGVVTDLVNEVNCPPPPPEPEPEKKPKKEKDDEHGNGDENGKGKGGDEHVPPGHAKNGGFVPPGQAKLKGEG